MADLVKVEYRGIDGELAVGERLVVRAVGGGLLHLDREPIAPVAPTPAPQADEQESEDA